MIGVVDDEGFYDRRILGTGHLLYVLYVLYAICALYKPLVDVTQIQKKDHTIINTTRYLLH